MINRRWIVLILLGAAACAQEKKDTVENLAPFVPTPELVVEKMLELGELKPGEKMFDLGSGDGRIVIMAAQKFKADATGVEYNDERWKQSSQKIKSLGLEKTARIIHGDIFKQDYSRANLITVYLLTSSNEKIRPMLEKQLKKRARIVSHDFTFSGWTQDRVLHVEEENGHTHTLYLYRR